MTESKRDDMRASRRERDALKAALRELVELQDLSDRIDAACLYPGLVMTKAERDAAFIDYRSRKQDAWRAARALLAAPEDAP